MITCTRCGKENQKHYKFCLGCGADLTAAAKNPTKEAVPHEALLKSEVSAKLSVPPRVATHPSMRPIPPVSSSSEGVKCPKCSTNVPFGFKFCGACGSPVNSGVKAAAKDTAPASGFALTALRADGGDGVRFSLKQGTTVVGRNSGDPFTGDVFLSVEHASFRIESDEQAFVKDAGSVNGVYLKISSGVPIEIKPGGCFRVGQELLRYDLLEPPRRAPDGTELFGSKNPGYVARLSQVVGLEELGDSFLVAQGGIQMGRERGDILFPEDGYVSSLHCRLHFMNDKAWVTDLGSSNGTFVRLTEEQPLKSGDLLLIGQQLFRFQ